MVNKAPQFYERPFEKCVVDGHLRVKELRPVVYTGGHGLSFKGKYGEEVHHIEYKIVKYNRCRREKRGCRGVWVGFKIGGNPSPAGVYKCKHGLSTSGLVCL